MNSGCGDLSVKVSAKSAWPVFQATDDELTIVTELSRFYGSQPEIVLAGGGNTSCKTSDRLFIKPSGTALAAMTPKAFVEMDRAALDELLARKLDEDPQKREAQFQAAIGAARCHPEKGQRPSVEVLLHHLIPATYVVHSHPTVVNTLTCCIRGKDLSEELFGNDILWLPYVDPGFVLAQSLKQALADYAAATGRVAPKAILLANHGLIVAADDPEAIRSTTAEILERIDWRLGDDWLTAPFGAAPQDRDKGPSVGEIEAALRHLQPERPTAFDESDVAAALVGSNAGKAAACGGPLTPDQIVYCGSFPLWFDVDAENDVGSLAARLTTAIAGHAAQFAAAPKVLLFAGVGLFAIADTQRQAILARDVYIDAIKVMAGARRLGGISYLTERQRKFIDDWEVEAYRRQVAATAHS